MSRLSEIKSLRLQGTNYDRRSKGVNKEIVVYLWQNKEKLNLKIKDIASICNINKCMIYRYKDYDRYLQNCRRTSKEYNHKLGKEIISEKNKRNYRKVIEYKTTLCNKFKI